MQVRGYRGPYDPTDRGLSGCRCGQVRCDRRHPIRAQLTSYGVVVADEVFGQYAGADAFVLWFFGQKDLPRGGAVTFRVDLEGPVFGERFPRALIPGIRERFIAAVLPRELSGGEATQALSDAFEMAVSRG